MIVLDTTVLVYAIGVYDPFRGPCRELVQGIADGVLQATTTAEVIQEFVHVRARRRGRSDARRLGNDYIDLLAPLLPITSEDLRHGLALYEKVERLGAVDAVLAAAALAAGASALASADRAFGAVPRLTHVVPDRDGVQHLIEGAGPQGGR